MLNKKLIITSTAVFMMLTFTVTILPLPIAAAQPFPKRATFAYVGAVPNPVGVGQETLIHVGITQYVAEYYGWQGLTVTVTKPDGTTETLGPIKTDPTGGTG